jgi:predicted outer membrane protein
MSQRRLALVMVPLVSATLLLAASCSDAGESSALKPGSGKVYQQPKDAGSEASTDAARENDAASPSNEAGAPSMPRDISTTAQALQVILVAYDSEIQEGEIGKSNATTPPVQAFSTDLIDDMKSARTRLRSLASAKKITPSKSNLSDRMRFESQGAMSHLNYVLPKMFNDAYVNRRIATANSLLRALDEEIVPVVGTDDEELRSEIDTIHQETEARLSRAEAVKSGLSDPGSSAGMFEDTDTPAPKPPTPVSSDAGK